MTKFYNDDKFSGDFPLRYNTINLFGPVDTAMAEQIITQLQFLDYKFKMDSVPMEERVITMQINSPGGVITDGLAIIDTMHFIDAKIMTVALGMAASMAAVILAAGTKGMRAATKNSEILLHQPLGGASGQASDIIIAAKHIERTRNNINNMLSEYTGRSIRQIAKDTDRDNILSAEQAMSYGVVDHIIMGKYDIAKEKSNERF